MTNKSCDNAFSPAHLEATATFDTFEAWRLYALIMTNTNLVVQYEDLDLSHLSELFEGSTDCIKILTFDGRILRVNTSSKVALELDNIHQLDGQSWPDLWPSSQKAQVEFALAEGRQGRRSRFTAFGNTLKGTTRWWNVEVTPIETARGTINALLAVSRDVTELIRKKEAILGAMTIRWIVSIA